MTWLAPPPPDDTSTPAPEARLDELSTLAQLGRAVLGAQLDLGRLARLIYEQAGQIVDTTIFQLGLFDGDRYRMLIWVVDGEPQAPREFRLTPQSPGIVGWVRNTSQSLLVSDYQTEFDSLPAKPRYLSDHPPRSAVFVPLLAGERALGVMAIQSRRPSAFSEEDLRLLSIIANYAAAALENARLFEQTQRRAAQLQLLAEVSQRLNVLQPLPAFYRQVVELISQKFGEYFVSIFEPQGEVLRLVATTRPDWQGNVLVVPLGTGPIGEAAQKRKPVIVHDLPEYGGDDSSTLAAMIHSEMALPLEVDERLLGVLNVQSQTAAFDDTVVALFSSLAAQMAFAALEAQVYTAEQRRAEQLAAIAQASRAVVSTLELDELLDDVLDLVDERFGYDRARIFLLQDGKLIYRAGTEAWEARWGHVGLIYALDGPGVIAAVGRTQRALVVEDVTTHPDYVYGPGLSDTRAEMAVPLMMAGRLLGVFDVQSPQTGLFTADDAQILQTLADTLAVGLRNARLFEAERRRRRLAETLREVSTALTSTLSLGGVLDLILSGLSRVVHFDVASILLVNEIGELCLRATRAPNSAAIEDRLGQPLNVRLFPRGEALPAALPFSDVDSEHDYHDLFDLPDPHACLGAPLVLKDDHLGYLVVDRVGIEEFPPEEVELIAAFASQASVAMDNARLYTAQREQAWISTALLQVAEAMAQTSALEESLATVTRVTPMLVGVNFCAVLLMEEMAFSLRAYHHPEAEAALRELPGGIPLAAWPRLSEMMTTQAPVVCEPDDDLPEALRGSFNGVMILLPLWVRGAVQGALVVGQAPGEAPFTTQRIRLISGIANQASLALESALLDQAQQEEAWVNAALLQVAEAVAGQPTLDEALEMVARLTPMLVGVERTVIYRWEAEAQVFRPSQWAGIEPTELEASASELEVDPQTPTTGSNLCKLPEPLAEAWGVDFVTVWPLWARGELLGALAVENVPNLGRRLNILNGIAHQLTLAMENAALAREVTQQQRLEREMELGRDIQASFLPQSCPQPPGWEVAAFWRSARIVGGDFYDFIRLRTKDGVERWGIVVADVSDKGVPAALFMALARTLLRSAAMNRTSPAATLSRLNELILADARSEQFVTMFYGVWEPSTGRFVYANGGHNPPIWVRANGEYQRLKVKGAALAVFEKVKYAEDELYFEPGDVLLLYSDGLTDAINAAQEDFGLERVINVATAARSLSASALMDTLTETVDWHVGDVEAFDDMTMVVVKRVAGRSEESR